MVLEIVGRFAGNPLGALIDLGGDLLGLPPQVKSVAKIAANFATGNLVGVALGGVELFGQMVTDARAKAEYVSPPGGGSCAPGYAPDPRPTAVDPNLPRFQEALRTLEANYEVFDTAAGRRDGLFARADLAGIAANPCASFGLRRAAQFLLEHPEYFNRLEMAAGIGGRDGLVGRADIHAALAQTRRQHVSAETSGPGFNVGSCGPAGGPVDPLGSRYGAGTPWERTGTVEDRVQSALLRITERADREIEQVVAQLEAEAGKGGPSTERLQLRLQQLMEKRRQMFDLMSNFSQKFNEMAKTAIQNMARA